MLRSFRADAQLDSFQRAVIVFTIVLCHCRRRRRPRCVSSLMTRLSRTLPLFDYIS